MTNDRYVSSMFGKFLTSVINNKTSASRSTVTTLILAFFELHRTSQQHIYSTNTKVRLIPVKSKEITMIAMFFKHCTRIYKVINIFTLE